ncbi:MAG: sugar ABC transporter permease [Nakamurella sp.]
MVTTDVRTTGAGATAVAATSRRVRRRAGKQGTVTPKHLRANGTAYLMIAPMVILLAVFVIWPLLHAIYLSGFEISFYKDPEFVGLQFYGYVLNDPQFWASLWVGLQFALMMVPTGMVLALLLATLLKNVSKRMASFLKTTIYIPAVVSSVIASVVFLFIYQDDGFANWFISLVRLDSVAWLQDPGTALPAIAVPALWLGFGVSTLIMLAALLDIPDSYYESASLDGAGFWAKTRFITIPGLRNVLRFLFVTGFTLSIQEFLLPLIMTNGGPVNATTTPNLYIFNSFRDGTPYSTSFSLTASLLLFVVLGSISAIIFRLISSDKAVDA